MFIETVQKERLQISPCQKDIGSAILAKLQWQVPGKQLEGTGVSLFPLCVEAIDDVEIHEGVLYPLVTYRLIIYQAFPGEVLTCTVEKQDASGILLNHPLLPSVFVPAAQLPPSSELTAVSGRMGTTVDIWGWKYNECILYIRMGEVCKVAIVSTAGSSIYASMDGPGLGPISWW
ncbi:DNA-directed RNA polymerase III subunit RPC8 [Nematocida minor]|uniref:DNA-directed RNA polymerase III subunit RPC8 n=1 Tax=Nematocida minor TaxID=1912983 RepID=UPI00221F9488|nr:DNA-directed RNA polymerase III subunit RPC8 [Nematocida minor]XP_051332024.1 DNA-directed RNA polymerase III subunit RPC8 [Nematocida minor]KAI5188754.1 DNA-directed RNA polymerase III subunit RPC8 [Nematocida minor]KAI5188858.1 DNA-directed RNA polymerase III subunit RPC8 [Nematocida minor]